MSDTGNRSSEKQCAHRWEVVADLGLMLTSQTLTTQKYRGVQKVKCRKCGKQQQRFSR